MATINYGLNARSTVATGGVAHIIDTTGAYSSGTLVSFRENATQFAFIDSDGHFNLNDNIRLTLGTGGDADIYYDATDLNINAAVAGSGTIITHTNIKPNADDGASLGISGTAFADLFLASGAVVNFNAGDVTLTHSANILTIGGGDTHVANDQGLVIGHTAQLTAGGDTFEFQMLGTSATDSTMITARWSADAFAPALYFYKSRNATIGSNTAVTTGDNLGQIVAFGDDGTDDDTTSSAIFFDTEGTISTGQVPGVIKLQVAAAGTLANALTIASDKEATFAGIVSVDDTTESTSGTTGSIHTDGGLGVAKKIFAIGDIVGDGTQVRFRGSSSGIFAQLDTNGMFSINETVNGNMTAGITINQGAADNEAFAAKSSDVGHAVTSLAEADTYGTLTKSEALAGGLLVTGYKDADGVAGHALQLRGVLDETAADTTKSTAGIGIVTITAGIEGSNTIADAGADENLMVIQNNATTRFLFDAEGSGHADVEFTTFDQHDDIAILDDMEALMIPDMFGQAVKHDAEFFKREGLINDIRVEPNGKTRGMVNMTKLTMLHTGALRQLGAENRDLQDQLDSVRLEMKQVMKLLKSGDN